jgi:hypothetical protein
MVVRSVNRRRPAAGRGAALAMLLLAVAGLMGCSDDDAVPLEPGSSPAGEIIGTPHQLEPTEQMQDLAEQQCLDDPDLVEGVIEAVDPSNPDLVLASVVVDCDDVR